MKNKKFITLSHTSMRGGRSLDSPMITFSGGISATRFSFDDLVIGTIKKHLGYYAIQQMKMIMERTPKKYYHDLLFKILPIGKYKFWWRTNLISKVNYLPPSLTLSLSKITRNKIYI